MTRLLLCEAPVFPGKVVVQGDELHYLTRVRRHRPGDEVEVIGSDGGRFRAKVEHVEKARAVLLLERELPTAQTVWPVNLVLAVPKRNLMESIIRQASEIGVARIFPIRAERSIVRPGPDRVLRWRKVAEESIRQCGRSKALEVDDVRDLEDVLLALRGKGSGLLLHPSEGVRSLKRALSGPALAPPVSVAIGPEGGFTDGEIAAASEQDFHRVGLGAAIMRVETAAIAAAVFCVAHVGGFESIDNMVDS